MTDDSETIALRATVIGGDHLRAFLYLIRNSFLFLKWNRRFDSRAFTASTTLWATGAGEFHKHSIFTRRPQGENVCGLFNLVDADTETAFGGVPPTANSGDSIPFAAYPLFGNLPEQDARMRIIALLLALMLTGCAGDRLKSPTKCDAVSAVLANPSATRSQVAAAMEMGRNNRCFGT